MKKYLPLFFILLVSVTTCNAQDFWLTFRYNTSSQDHRILKDDHSHTLLGSSVSLAIATNRTDGCFYEQRGKLRKCSTTDGTTQDSSLAQGVALRPVVVDKDNQLWTINYIDSNCVKVWSADLSSMTKYVVDVSNVEYIALTYDCLWAYIITGNSSDTLFKFNIDSLDGGTEEWSLTGFSYEHWLCVDDSDHVYLSGDPSSGGLFHKVDSNGNLKWSVAGSHVLCWYQANRRIIAPQKGCTNSRTVRMYDSATGTEIGYSNDLVLSVTCCAVNDTTILVGTGYYSDSGGTHGIYDYRSTDWASPQDSLGMMSVADDKDHRWEGDATGEIHESMLNEAAGTVRKNVIVIW